jgi:diguanylate cyclase (GGDEF)-like protein
VEVRRAARFEGCVRRDALTDLASRSYLHEYLGKVTANAEAHGEIVLLAFIDLNGFKRINDRFGHKNGDALLRVVANCLHDECRTRDLVARYGGDEFVVAFVSPMNQRSESISRMNQIIERAFREVRAKEGYGEIGASAGISVFPCPAVSVDDLIHKADEAMYRAKESGKLLAICIHKEDHTLVCRFPSEVSAD